MYEPSIVVETICVHAIASAMSTVSALAPALAFSNGLREQSPRPLLIIPSNSANIIILGQDLVSYPHNSWKLRDKIVSCGVPAVFLYEM